MSEDNPKEKKEQPELKPLTPKQERFCEEYMIDLNATQAAKRSGYSEHTAKDIGCENLAKPNIQEKIKQLQADRAERVQVDADDVLKQLDLFRKANIKDYIELTTIKVPKGKDEKGKDILVDQQVLQFKDFDELTEDQLMCIESIKHGKHGIEMRLQGKEWTTEKINRHIGFYLADNKQREIQGPSITIIQDNEEQDLS